jgi:hypothetical protein
MITASESVGKSRYLPTEFRGVREDYVRACAPSKRNVERAAQTVGTRHTAVPMCPTA